MVCRAQQIFLGMASAEHTNVPGINNLFLSSYLSNHTPEKKCLEVLMFHHGRSFQKKKKKQRISSAPPEQVERGVFALTPFLMFLGKHLKEKRFCFSAPIHG